MKKKYFFIIIALCLVGFGSHAKPAFATTGNMYVVDNGINNVEIRSATGTYISQFGAGSNNGLVDPMRSAFDGSGNLWVIDQGADNIKKFIASGTTYVYGGIQLGSYGSGNGQFDDPNDIVFDSGGNMWINDSANGRAEKFVASGTTYKYSTNFGVDDQTLTVNASGSFLMAEPGYNTGLVDILSSTGTLINTFGALGSSCSGKFTNIYGIAATGTSVFVVDQQNDCVEQWTASGTTYVYKTNFGTSGAGALSGPQGVTVDAGGNVWVADSDNDRVVEFVASGTTYKYSKAIGSQGIGNTNFDMPSYISFDSSGNMYVVDENNNRISKFNSSGTFVAQFGSSGNGYFSDLEGIGQDSSGNIWLLSAGDNNVEEFSSSGVYMSQFSLGAWGLGEALSGLTVDSSNNIWVSRFYNSEIQEYSPTGTPETTLVGSGSGTCSGGDMNYVKSPTFDSAGHIWMIQDQFGCVQEWSAAGTFMNYFNGPGAGFSDTGVLAIDGSGNIWVSDDGASTSIDEFSSAGTFMSSFSVATSAGNNEGITGLAFDSNGKLWAADQSVSYGDKAIDEFSTAGALLFATGTFGYGGGQSFATPNRIIFATSGGGGGGNPSISSFFASPTSVASGTTSTLSWTVTNASSVAISPIALSTSTLSGSIAVHPTSTTTYTLTATNPSGTSTATASVTVDSTAPTTPSGLSATSISGSQINLTWTSSTDSGGSGLAGYNIFRCTGSCTPSTKIATSSGAAYSDTGLTASTTYTYAISAYDGVGNISATSSNASATTQASGGGGGVAGTMYVPDWPNNRVEVFSSTTAYLRQLGCASGACSGGSATGTTYEPWATAIDASGNVWVSDQGNNRIDEFSATGTFVRSVGSGGSGNGQFNTPENIAIDASGNLWVVDGGNNRVQEFSATGTYLSQFGSSGDNDGAEDYGLFNFAEGITIDSVGNLWVSDDGEWIQEFSPSGVFEGIQFGSGGSGNGQFSGPDRLAIDTNGNFWIADWGNARVQEMSPTGTYLNQFGGSGSTNGLFGHASGLAFDNSGNLWATDRDNSRVQEFTASGTNYAYHAKFGTNGTGNSQFGNGPGGIGIYLTPNGTTAPTISSVSAAPTQSTAVITWTTNVAASSFVRYGMSAAYNAATTINNTYVTSHSMTLTGLAANTTYDYQVVSSDGNYTASGNYTFTTSPITSASGNTYVVDNGNNRVEIFSSAGTYVGQFGNGASTSFNDPYGVAVDASGNIWTTDYNNNDVLEYSPSGAYMSSFGSEGSSNGQLYQPTKIVIDSSGNFWIADSGNNRLEEFSSAGAYMNQISIGNFSDGLAINGSGTILVAEDNNIIYEYNTSGTLLGSFGGSGSGNGKFNDIDGLTVSGNKLIVDDASNSRVQIMVASGTIYAYSAKFGNSGVFCDINNAAFDSSGNLWISDKCNNNFDEYYASGTTYVYHASFGSAGSGNGQFLTPGGIAIDSSNNIYVADQGNNRIQKFTSTGAYSSQFGAPPAGSVNNPQDVAVDPSGNVWVTNYSQNRVQEFSAGGTYESGFSLNAAGYGNPNGIAIDSGGNIWVAGGEGASEFSPSGTLGTQIGGTYGSAPGQFSEGGGIAISSSGNIWVGDGGNSRAQEFSSTGTYIGFLGGTNGSSPGQLCGCGIPQISIDKGGNVWLIDWGNNRVQEFSATGTYESKIDFPSAVDAYPDIEGLAVDSSGNVWMSDAYHGGYDVVELSASGTLLNQIGYTGTGNGSSLPGQFYEPRGIAIGTGGTTNISSASTQHWAWNDKIGWIDFYDTQNIIVSSSSLTGYASSSAGYFSLDCGSAPSGFAGCGTSNYGVSNDGHGNLAGWAWNDLYGWVSFCGNSSGGGSTWNGTKWVCPSSPTYQVVISPTTGVFSGWAWNDTIGWISFNCSNTGNCGSPSQYDVVTSWTATQSSMQGTLDSETFDTGVSSGAQLNSVTWQGTQPASTTVGFQFAVSASSTGPWTTFTGPDGTSATQYIGLPGAPITLTNYPALKARYFRYRIILNTNSTGTVTPQVKGVSVNWSK